MARRPRLATLGRDVELPHRRHLRTGRPGAAPDAARQPLARRRHRRREGHPHPGRTAPSSSSTPQLECFVDLDPQQKGAHMSRFEEVVNEAIDEVVLGEALQGRDARRAHRRARARAPGRAARRGHDRGALPGAQAGARLRHPHAGDLHAASARRSRPSAARAGSSASQAQGMTACPCAQELRRRRARASGSPPTASPTTRSSASSSTCPVATHNQRGLGTLHIGCPEDVRGRDRRARPAARSSRTR